MTRLGISRSPRSRGSPRKVGQSACARTRGRNTCIQRYFSRRPSHGYSVSCQLSGMLRCSRGENFPANWMALLFAASRGTLYYTGRTKINRAALRNAACKWRSRWISRRRGTALPIARFAWRFAWQDWRIFLRAYIYPAYESRAKWGWESEEKSRWDQYMIYMPEKHLACLYIWIWALSVPDTYEVYRSTRF